MERYHILADTHVPGAKGIDASMRCDTAKEAQEQIAHCKKMGWNIVRIRKIIDHVEILVNENLEAI